MILWYDTGACEHVINNKSLLINFNYESRKLYSVKWFDLSNLKDMEYTNVSQINNILS